MRVPLALGAINDRLAAWSIGHIPYWNSSPAPAGLFSFNQAMTPRAQDIYSATLIIGAILIVWGGMAWLLVEEAVRLFN
jgi:hypothetical protein